MQEIKGINDKFLLIIRGDTPKKVLSQLELAWQSIKMLRAD